MNTRSSWFASIVLISLVILTGMLASCSSDSSSSDTKSLRIYEMVAGKGSFTAVAGDTTGNAFQLSLSNVPSEILYFTDRPAREAGYDSVGNVMNTIWPKVYGVVAPNAIMKATTANQGTIDLFCILDKPAYSAATGQLSFTLTYLNGNRKPLPNLAVTDVKLIIMNNAATSGAEWSQLMTGVVGTFEPATAAGTCTFRLQQPVDPVFSFASAPSRQSMTFTVKEFIQGWQARFGDTPPNVSIAYDPANDQIGGVQIATLSNPVYDEQTGIISFTAKVLYGTNTIGKSGLSVQNPSLFFDGGASDALTVNIKNDSGRTAYIKFYTNKGKVGVEPVSDSVGDGKTATFSVTALEAGRINISYDKPLVADEPDGARDTVDNKDYLTRFDKVEFTYKLNPKNGKMEGKANLTAVDFYSIPMILETSIEGTTIERLTLKDDTTGNSLKQALLDTLSNKPLAEVKSGNDTIRILSPLKRPGAYPGFDAFLTTLENATLTISGTYFGSPLATYNYTGSIGSDTITLKDGKDTISIDMKSLRWDQDNATDRNGIYTCNGPFTVNGNPAKVGDNTIYSAVYRDLVTALNLGFVKLGVNDSATWWNGTLTPFTTGTGTYNSYAKVIADNYTGAYGFSFSDRYKHILADLGGGDDKGNGRIDTLTITLLNDAKAPPPYTPSGTLNPDPKNKVTQFNLNINMGSDAFYGMPFTFHQYEMKYKVGTAFDFPYAENTTFPPGHQFANINNVPAVNGMNLYNLEMRGNKYLVLVKVENRQVKWGTISGGGNGTYNSDIKVLFVGGLDN